MDSKLIDSQLSPLQLQLPDQQSQPSAPAAPARSTLWSVMPAAPPAGLMIEPEYHQVLTNYMKAPTPQSADALLQAVNPVVDEAVRSYAGGEVNSVTARARAKRLVLEAIDRYDPARAKLRTHLLSHLRGLRRTVERSTSGVYVPEQWRLDSRHATLATTGLRDELGREPSDREVADRAGLSVDRVRRARQVPGVLSGSQYESAVAATGIDPKAWNTWVEGVYNDLHGIDQVILEHSFGLHGKPVLPANRIAKLVNLSPGAVSQRKTRIQQSLNEYENFMGRR